MGQKTLWDSLKRLAKDGWITIKPNGRRNKGQPVLLGENGEILGGMGGKFNGLKMKDVKDANKKLKQKNEYAKSGHSKGESPELYNAPIPSAAANAPAIPGDYKNSPDFKKLTPDAQTMVNQTAAHIKKLPLAKMAEHGPALYEELDKVIKELANNGSKFDSKVSEMVTNLNIAAMSAATATPTPPNQPKPSKSETSQFEGYDKLSSLNASEIDKHAKVINESKATPEDKAFMMDALRQATSYMAENGMDAAAAKVLSGINGVWVASSNPDALKKAKDALSGLLGEMNATVELVNAGGTYASKQEAAQPVQPTQPAQPAAKQAEYEKQQAFNKTHSFTQQTTDADRNKFKYATDKFLSDQAKADVAAIPNTLQNGKFAKTKHKNKFEQELGEGGDSFKKYSGMAYGLMKSSNKDLATKAQNIAVAVANGQMEGSKAISLLQSMDAMQKVKDYTDPKSEPPAYTSIHSDDIHNSGTFKASALPPDPKVAVMQYTGNAYASLNGQLRQNQKLSAKNKKLMDDINKTFALPEVKAKDNLTVYRGITSTQLQHLPIGGTFTNKGFVSTSSDAYEASKFAGSNGALMEIRVKKGQPALSVKDVSTFPDEKEVLLPAATQFTVVGKKIGPEGRPVLIVDYVPPANLAKDRALTYLQRAGWVSTPKDDAQRRRAIFDALHRM